jgi:hypothetical protein
MRLDLHAIQRLARRGRGARGRRRASRLRLVNAGERPCPRRRHPGPARLPLLCEDQSKLGQRKADDLHTEV